MEVGEGWPMYVGASLRDLSFFKGAIEVLNYAQ